MMNKSKVIYILENYNTLEKNVTLKNCGRCDNIFEVDVINYYVCPGCSDIIDTLARKR